MRRNDVHLVDYCRSKRQSKYMYRPSRKGIWLTIDGEAAARAGVKFTKLSNDVIVTTGISGTMPPCVITSAWAPNRNGAARLVIPDRLENPPKLLTVYNMPNVGPPCLTTNAIPVLLPLSDTDVEHRLKTPSPPAASPSGFLVHRAPGENTPIPLSKAKTWRPASQTMDDHDKHEQERPPSWQDEILPVNLKCHSPDPDSAVAKKVRLAPNLDASTAQPVSTHVGYPPRGDAPAGATPLREHPADAECSNTTRAGPKTITILPQVPRDSPQMMSSRTEHSPRMLSSNTNPQSITMQTRSDAPRMLPSNADKQAIYMQTRNGAPRMLSSHAEQPSIHTHDRIEAPRKLSSHAAITPIPMQARRDAPRILSAQNSRTPRNNSRRVAPRMLSSRMPYASSRENKRSDTPRRLSPNTPRTHPQRSARSGHTCRSPTNAQRSREPYEKETRKFPTEAYRNDAARQPIVPSLAKSSVRFPCFRNAEQHSAPPPASEIHNLVKTAASRAMAKQPTPVS